MVCGEGGTYQEASKIAMTMRQHIVRLACGLLALLAAGAVARAEDQSPTPEEYVAHVGGDAKIIPSGEFELDGIKLYCGTRPTVIDDTLDDYGAAYPGFL